jgi:hypothetical protein
LQKRQNAVSPFLGQAQETPIGVSTAFAPKKGRLRLSFFANLAG